MSGVERSQWGEFAEEFSRQHAGWNLSVESRGADGGIETILDRASFQRVRIEECAGRDLLVIAFRDDSEDRPAEVIEDVSELSFLEGESDRCWLVVGRDDGTGCVLQLTNPFTVD